MRTIVYLACVTLAIHSTSASADSDTPVFEDCQVAVTSSKKAVHLKLSTHESRQYASQLKHAAKQPINFAGHYIFASWGCGAGCIMGATIDAKDGRVVMLPFTVSDWPLDVTEPLSFKKDSCLLFIKGSRNEEGSGTYYYRFDGNKFNLLKSIDR
jgi:hypothetical protein